MVGGALANFIATLAAWRIFRSGGGRWSLVGVGVQILFVTLIVGSYLSFLLGIPLQVSWLGILLGSFVAIGVLGTILFFALSRSNILAILEAHGLRETRNNSQRK
jgi:uncharacterized membrane protein YccC